MIIDKLLTAEAVGKQLAQKQSDACSPRTSNQVSVNSKEVTEMIDLTMDDEEIADGDAHTASGNKHTKLSCNATSSQRGVVMKIDVLCIRTLLGRSCKYTWKTRLMAASVDELHTLTRARDLHLCQTTCSLQMLVVEQRRRQSRLSHKVCSIETRSQHAHIINVKHDIDRSTSTSYCCGSYCRSAHVKCGCRHRRQKGEATEKTTQERHYTKSRGNGRH